MLGQMKMEDEISGETPSPGTPGADDGGTAGIATLLEGIILGSAWVTCGGACCGMVVVVVRPNGPMVVCACLWWCSSVSSLLLCMLKTSHGCRCGAASFVLLVLSRFIFAQ